MPFKEDLTDSINFHFRILSKCFKNTRRGTAVLATLKKSRYPQVYPRDVAAMQRCLYNLTINNLHQEKALGHMEGITKFIVSIEKKTGLWGQKYTTTGRNVSLYIQEDNTAHGILTIGYYLLACYKTKKKPLYEKRLISVMKRAMNTAIEKHYNKEAGLFYSTTSIHESSIEKGYTLWVNLAYWDALNLIDSVKKTSKYKKVLSGFARFRKNFEKKIKTSFVEDNRYIARLSKEGTPDLSADITLLSPFYFNFNYKKNLMENTIKYMRKSLWDIELGLLQRYPHVKEDLACHTHAGNGPWIQYSAMLAQYYYSIKKKHLGDEVMALIWGYSTRLGYLPEHLSTIERFKDFIKTEWKTGLDFRKEFDPDIIPQNLDFDKIFGELQLMERTYAKIKKNMGRTKRKYIRFAVPLAWSHAEFILALLIKMKNRNK